MSKMNQEQIWNFAKDFAKKLYEIDEYWFDEEYIQTKEISISMYSLSQLAEAEQKNYEEYCEGGEEYDDGLYESDDKLEDIIPRVAEDDDIEAVFFCEGDLWETLYYAETYGSNNATVKAIYKAFTQTVSNHGMWYEWGSGTIFLYQLSDAESVS